MSLEEAINANTAALRELTLEIQAHLNVPAEVKEVAAVVNPTKAQTIAKVAGDVASAAVGLTGAAPLAADAGKVVEVTVTDVLSLASQLIAKTDKATLSKTLAEFNLSGKKLSDITPEHLKPAYDKLTAALAACQQA